MRIMVIGAKSAGKSTFSDKLSKKLAIPVVHIDAVVNKVGRDNKMGEELIRQEADKPDWIIDGNSFTRDRSYRLEKTDYVIIFTINRFKSFFAHCQRWFEEKMGIKKDRFGRSDGLHLWFAMDFAFRRWPKREKEIIAHARSLNKKIFFIRNFKEADSFIKNGDFL